MLYNSLCRHRYAFYVLHNCFGHVTLFLPQAMAVLERFSEKEADYHLYQARQNAIREEKTRQKLLEDALLREEEALRDKEEALRDKEEALLREEETVVREQRLREKLKKAGIDPDE